MYNDEQNLYHYTYRKDGSEPGQRYDARSASDDTQSRPTVDEQLNHFEAGRREQPPIQEMKPVKKNRMGLKIAALALVCALLGGAVGGGVVWAVGNGGSATEVNVSSRPATAVAVKTVDGKTAMTDAEVYAAGVNSVVSINVTGTSGTNFFGQPVKTASAGSGFVLTKDGYIVTNYHVVKDADTVKVTMYNGDEYDAKYVGGDEDYDIAVIKVEAADLQPVTLGDSDKLNVGDHVLAVGNPLGELTFSLTSGVVSALDREVTMSSGVTMDLIQTDCAINSGNSGGALFNLYGEVIGITNAKYSGSGSSGQASIDNIGFAIPINSVRNIVESIIENGYIVKPYIGVSVTDVSAETQSYGLPQGAAVKEVTEGSPAEQAGLQVNDIITRVGDTEITCSDDLVSLVKECQAGDELVMQVYRSGETLELTVTVAEKQQSALEVDDESQKSAQSDSQMINPWQFFFGGQI